MSLLKKGLLGLAITAVLISVLWFPLALGLMAGFPFALWEDPIEPVDPVGARATFEESAACVGYYAEGHRLDNDSVAFCFPTQTPAKENALIACFNTYERNHPDHEGWPEKNMRGCTWDGLTAVPVRNVASLAFDKVVAVPTAPLAGKPFVLRVGLTRSDSAAKIKERVVDETDNPAVNVAVTINGENVAVETVEGCAPCRLSGNPESEYWFSDGKIWVKFGVPETAAGKRVAIKMTVAEHDTPTVTKDVTFTVRR